MKQKYVVYAIALSVLMIIAAGFAGYGPGKSLKFAIFGRSEEAPIIVKNGSIDFTVSEGQWVDNSATWSYEPGDDSTHRNKFWVRADLNDGTRCRGDGRTVRIDYSVASFNAVFTPGRGVNGVSTRTQLAPKAGISSVNAQQLRHGTAGDGGFIQDVKVDGRSLRNGQQDCVITQANLVQVNVCSNPSRCQ